MRGLELRLQRIETQLGVGQEPVALNPEEEARQWAFREAIGAMAKTMSSKHWEVVSKDLNGGMSAD